MNNSKKKPLLVTALSTALFIMPWAAFAQHGGAASENPHAAGHGQGHPDMSKTHGMDPHRMGSMHHGSGMGKHGSGMGMMGHTPLPSFENTCENPMGHEMGMGAGLGAMGPFAALDFTKEQQSKIRDIRRELRKNHWELSEQISDQCDELADRYAGDNPDFNGIGQAYGKIAEARYKMMQLTKDARKRVIETLSSEQREKLEGMSMMEHGTM